MARFDLEDEYLSLDGQGGLARHPVEGFWETVEDNPTLKGTLISAYVTEGDWPNWEMHPEGEELLVQLDGCMTLILDEPGGERRIEMRTGATAVVPRGVWHTARAQGLSRFLAITYGAGTQHRTA
jgi:mannose-6-phosphate isomerase-like protein (cupin superfamily)